MNKHTIGYIFAIMILGLGVVIVYIALRLFQLKNEPVAPNQPVSIPAASEPSTVACEDLLLTLNTSPSPTPQSTQTPTPTQSPTLSPTSTPEVGGNPTPSPTPTPTIAATPSPTTTTSTANPTPVSTASPTLPPDVPVTGSSTPVIAGIAFGIILLILAIRMAL